MKRGYVYGALALGLVILLGLWYVRHRRDVARDGQIAAPTLNADEKTKIVFDPKRHTVTRITRLPGGRETATTSFLNTHGPVAVVEKKDGSTILIQRTWGTETSPFIGVALGSDIRGRAALGLNLFYVQRWEVGGGLLLGTDVHDTRLFAHVSYNAYNNIYVALGIDNRSTAQLMAGLKF